ncbi:MAG: YbaB/EbfC family nucleoid-associated protein [Candidatus Obscuribacterales bacterium]|nr:YbaB/EbfC family nucleoid-associated protein [Candidatus Obscuribacterales bacterium]
MQPDFEQIMRSMSKAQEQLMKVQGELSNTVVEGQAGGGAVKVTCNGEFSFKSLKIKPEAVDLSDLTMLEDLILAAVNDASRKAKEAGEEKMKSSMSGIPMPPGLF